MAKALVAAFSNRDQRERSTLDHIARIVREEGYIPATKRGVGASGMTTEAAANLFLALNGCDAPKDGRLYHGSRAEKVWTITDEAAFLKVAPAHLRLPLLLAVWTGQREGDLLRLPWSAYHGQNVRLRQSKGGRRVTIPVGAPLKAALDAAKKVSTLILVNSRNRPWTENGFRTSWREARMKTDIVDRTFHDLRGTAATRLAMVGCTVPEIATFTGHSLADVRAILDAHYFHRDLALAERAIRELEAGTKKPN